MALSPTCYEAPEEALAGKIYNLRQEFVKVLISPLLQGKFHQVSKHHSEKINFSNTLHIIYILWV